MYALAAMKISSPIKKINIMIMDTYNGNGAAAAYVLWHSYLPVPNTYPELMAKRLNAPWQHGEKGEQRRSGGVDKRKKRHRKLWQKGRNRHQWSVEVGEAGEGGRGGGWREVGGWREAKSPSLSIATDHSQPQPSLPFHMPSPSLPLPTYNTYPLWPYAMLPYYLIVLLPPLYLNVIMT